MGRNTIIIVGLDVPQAVLESVERRDVYIVRQTIKFQRNLTSALIENGVETATVSSPPITDYSRIRFYGGFRWSSGGACNITVPLVNVIGLKQVLIAAGCIYGIAEIVARLWLSHGHMLTAVLVADSYLPHLIAGRTMAWLLRVPCIAVVTDMPSSMRIKDFRLKAALRGVDRRLVLAGLRATDGLVVLSEFTVRDYFPRHRWCLVPGFHSGCSVGMSSVASAHAGILVIGYFGALVREHGVDVLLAAFSSLSGTEFELWVTGRGDLELTVQAAAREDGRIKALGFIDASELDRRWRALDVFVCLRADIEGHSRYSFPSKLIEALERGVIVISNRFPSLPIALEEFLVMIDEVTPTAVAKALCYARNNQATLVDRAYRGARYVAETYNRKTLGAKIGAMATKDSQPH